MPDVLRVLQVEDSDSDAALIVRILEKTWKDVRAERVEEAGALRAALAGKPWDVIIADYRLPRFDAPAALATLRQTGLDIPFIVVSGTIGEEVAVAMMKAGAHDYLMKSSLARLGPVVKREIVDAEVRRERRRAEQALRLALAAAEEGRRLLDTVFTAQTDGVFVCDASGLVIRTNPAAFTFFGFDPTGMRIEQIVDRFPLLATAGSCPTCRALRGETVVAVENASGGRAVETSAAPMRDDAGAILGAVTIARDITERKRAENALRESEETLRQLCRSALDAIAMVDEEGRTILCNPAAERMFGYSAAEMLGQSIHHLVVPFPQQSLVQSRMAVFRGTGQGPQIGKIVELTARRKDGSEFPIELSLGAIEQGQKWKAVGIVRDMTAAHEARRKIDEANERFHALAEQSRTIVWEVDAAGLFTYVSPASESVWGYRPDELAGRRHFYDLHPEEGRELFIEMAFQIFARKENLRGLENPVQAKDGRIVWVSTHGIPVLDARGELAGYRGSDIDITERKRAEEEGQISERRYRSLFRHMLNGLAYCRMLYDDRNQPVDFVTLEVNETFERLTGLRDVIGKRVTEVIPGIRETVPEFFEIQGRVALTGKSESFEFDFKPIGRWLSVSVYSAEKGYFVAIFDDITERKRHESDREAMVALLRLLNSPGDTRELIEKVAVLLRDWQICEHVGIALWDGGPPHESCGVARGVLQAGNFRCEQIAAGELVPASEGSPAAGRMCSIVLSGRLDPGLSCFTPGGSFWTNNAANLLAHTSGEEPPCRNPCFGSRAESVALVPLRSSAGTLGLLHFHDPRSERFTPAVIARLERAAASLAIALEQRRAQDALRASEERYRLISENTADVIWMLDLEFDRFTYVSPSARRVLGYLPEEIVGNSVRFTLTPESYEFAVRRIAEEMEAFRLGRGTPTQVQQIDQVRKDGTIIRTEVSTMMLPNGQGGAGAILGVTRDITERVQTEAILRQAQKLESVGRLAGGVAHDFNNLLTVINGYSKMVLRELSPADPIRGSINEIVVAGERAAALTAQLLTMSRNQVVQPRAVNLNEIVAEIEKMLGRLIGEDIRVKSVLRPGLGCVLADPGQLHQVLMNLAVNSRDAMPSGGTLLIETAGVVLEQSDTEPHPELKPGPHVQLTVSDTGIGMTKDVLAHMFEPFFTTKKAGEGTGLGLATVYGIVRQCGGSIFVESELGHGTRFRILLPRVESPPSPRDEPESDRSGLRGTETVLVVEDQELVRRMLVRALRTYGYRVLEAANPGEALLVAESCGGPIHLLLTDMVMPGMSGRDLAGRLKLLRPAIGIIYMSGYADPARLDLQELDGAYLAKPFSPGALAAKVREVLGPRPAARTILVVDDEPGVRGLLRKVLTGAGYRVLEAGNGKEAVRQIESTTIDLMITDLAMPEQEGMETIERLHKVKPLLAIIAMSGQFAGPLLTATEYLGARATIAKPIQPELLLDTVARVLG